MKIAVLFIFLAILKGAYGDTERPAWGDYFILTDETVTAKAGETVSKITEIMFQHQPAQNFTSSGKKFTIWNKGLLISNGTNIVNKKHARKFRDRWNITEFMNFTLDDNKPGKFVINVTVRDFEPVDQIFLKIALHLADGETLFSPLKYWFVYDQAQTTTSPSPTPNITDRNPTSSPAPSTVSETSDNSQWSTSTATATTDVPYQSGPSNSAIFWTMICGFLILAVLIVREWIISQVMRILTYCQQNIPCIDQPSPSGNDPPTDLSPPGTGTSAQTCENVGTPTDSTEEQTRNGGNELLVLRPEHEDSEPMEHRSSMSAKQHQLRKSQAYQAGTTVPEYHEKDTLMGNT